MSLPMIVAIGFILDLLIGDPRRLYHPVQAIGALIKFLEPKLRAQFTPYVGGIVLLVMTAAITYSVTFFLASVWIGIEIYLIFTILATKTLGREAMKIHGHLVAQDIESARIAVSMLVSRDTDSMDEQAIIRATVETVSENCVDGVTAPLFYLFLGGAPLGMTYKAVNTLDSMVGYKNEKYFWFGKASARFDDLLNFIPARITAFFCIPLASMLIGLDFKRSLQIVVRDRFNHASPNSAHPESAFAGALNIRIGGPTSYFGTLEAKPYIGDGREELRPADIGTAVRLLNWTAVVTLLCGIIVHLCIGWVV